MLAKLLEPKTDLAAVILRLGLAAIFIVHGYLKLYVSFSLIPELSMDMQRIVGWAELICGLALAVGLFSRLAALGIIVMQAGAIVMVSGRHALEGLRVTATGADFMRVGPEYNLVLITMCLGVILLGSGALSLDYLLVKRCCRRSAPTT